MAPYKKPVEGNIGLNGGFFLCSEAVYASGGAVRHEGGQQLWDHGKRGSLPGGNGRGGYDCIR